MFWASAPARVGLLGLFVDVPVTTDAYDSLLGTFTDCAYEVLRPDAEPGVSAITFSYFPVSQKAFNSLLDRDVKDDGYGEHRRTLCDDGIPGSYCSTTNQVSQDYAPIRTCSQAQVSQDGTCIGVGIRTQSTSLVWSTTLSSIG